MARGARGAAGRHRAARPRCRSSSPPSPRLRRGACSRAAARGCVGGHPRLARCVSLGVVGLRGARGGARCARAPHVVLLTAVLLSLARGGCCAARCASFADLCSTFEKRLKELNPSVKQIKYDISDLYTWVDSMPDLGAMVLDTKVSDLSWMSASWLDGLASPACGSLFSLSISVCVYAPLIAPLTQATAIHLVWQVRAQEQGLDQAEDLRAAQAAGDALRLGSSRR